MERQSGNECPESEFRGKCRRHGGDLPAKATSQKLTTATPLRAKNVKRETTKVEYALFGGELELRFGPFVNASPANSQENYERERADSQEAGQKNL